ncbi:LacI family DNA-binding transcriptional regulator [Actinomadura viridis]|uniref:LacI family transcriptional regulator n=1 Tax=Actinomadura viridis TaxID=58110 RepID=A0A931DFW9_9ACTN|nr:LacI family DNA-binding transcriptional regulator [Actinomadura viridis]MBG6086018.1 LacI family transcriptional regulator [Actinomadura viridis]
MGITSRDVARLAGVSQPTVSRALRGDTRVSAETRRRVQEAARALGYVPSEAGRSLSTRSAKRVGVLVTDLTNPFYPHLVAPLHDELERLGYRMMLFAERSDEAIASERLLDRSIDGVVLTTTGLGSGLPAELHRRGLPFVYLNREGTTPADAAVVDNRLGAELAARELVTLGHERVAGIFGPEETSTGREREYGFRLALAEAGIGLPEARVRRGPFEFETGHAALASLLAAEPRPTAVFCGNDVIAIGALDAALRAGIRVPDELTVIGFDDIPMSAWESFRLTTVRHDLNEMAATAARLLVRRITGEAAGDPERVVFAPTFVARRTHARPPAG